MWQPCTITDWFGSIDCLDQGFEPSFYGHDCIGEIRFKLFEQLTELSGVVAVLNRKTDFIVIVKEHFDVDREKLIEIEDDWMVSISIRAIQNRSIESIKERYPRYVLI